MNDDRMLEIGLEELLGGASPPDVRGDLQVDARPRASRRHWLWGAALAAGILVTLTLVSRGDDDDVRALCRSLADAGRARASYVALLDATTRTPDRWSAVRSELRAMLEGALDANARSRVVSALSHAPEVESDLAMQVREFGDVLDTETLILLDARAVADATELLRADGRRDRGALLHAVWKIWDGNVTDLDFLEDTIGRPASLERDPHAYFAAVVTLYRNRRFDAWNVCWRIASRNIRELARRDLPAALRRTTTMYWFYDFLNIAEPLTLVDLRRRVELELRELPTPDDAAAEIERLLAIMN